MSKLHTIGTVSYYFGLMVIVVGFFFLATGLVNMLNLVMSQVSNASSGDFEGFDSVQLMNESGADIGPLEILISPADGVVDDFFEQSGIIQSGNAFQGAYYPKFRSFFSFLIIGLVFILMGIILRMADDFVDFVGKVRKKALKLESKSILYRDKKPIHNRIKIE